MTPPPFNIFFNKGLYFYVAVSRLQGNAKTVDYKKQERRAPLLFL